ncbi:probable glutamate receptor [Folsomia candida]|uniref:probable glutamate receptor n=1 Tax=Folsomia candida TaxID=158441 RepID=UPI001604DC06|nr:probable glutamate receptor [Folsomia candida]
MRKNLLHLHLNIHVEKVMTFHQKIRTSLHPEKNKWWFLMVFAICVGLVILLPGKVGCDDVNENWVILTPKDAPQPRKTFQNVTRPRRQILTPSNWKLKPVVKSAMSDMMTQVDLHLDFIADLAMFNGWTTVYLILPGEEDTELCQHASKMLIESRTNLRSECGTNQTKLGGLTPSRRMVIPIFMLTFLGGVPTRLNPTLLRPTRPVWVLGGGGESGRETLVKNVHPVAGGNCKWTLVWRSDDDGKTLMLEDVYGFPGVAGPISQIMGKWDAEERIRIDTELALGPVDFQGRMLRITTVAGPPVVFVSKTSKGGVRSSGYLPDILKIVSAQLNFTYEIMTPPDNKFGNLEANGSWSGMVGMLERKEADIAMMSFSLTAARQKVMDFSPPVEYSSVRLLIRRDWQNAELKWSAYLRPLEWDVWVTIPIFVVLGVITLAIFSYYKVLKITPFTSAWLLTSCFILQGQDEHSDIKVTPYRLVMGTFWVLSVVVFASYTARLTAFLAASNEVLPVSSLYQAVRNRNWKVGLVKGSAFIDRIRESQVEVLRGLYNRIAEDSSSLVESFQEGMDKVFKERYIFFTSELIPSFLIRSNCSYTWLPDKYFSGFGYMGYQKHLPFAPVISQRVSEIRQSGQMRRLFLKWWGTESVCFTNSGESFLGMSLYETGTAFLILLFGLSLAIALMLGEFYIRRPSKNSSRPGSDNSLQSRGESTARNKISISLNNGVSNLFADPQNAFPPIFNKSQFSF